MNEKNNFKTKVAMQVSFDRNLRHAKHLFSGLEELNKGEKELKSLEKWRDLSDKLRK